MGFYPRISYVMAYLLFSATIGLQLLCFYKVRSIFNKKTQAKKEDSPEEDSPEDGEVASDLSAIPANNFLETATIQPSIDDRWIEMKYAMFFNSFKETSKHAFFFTYWITLYNILYILLILSLQDVPVFQCLSIIILVILCLMTSATIKPFKDKSIALIFFSNFTCVLIAATINLTLAFKAAVYGVTSPDDQAGRVIFFVILVNCGINMIVLLGGVIYKLFLVIKNRIQKKKTITMNIPQQIEIARPNHPSNELEDPNPRINLQFNYQSNLPSLRSDDLLFHDASRRSEVQGYTDKFSILIVDKTRNNEEARRI